MNQGYLDEALQDLDDLEAENREEGLPPPAPEARRMARHILEQVAREFPRYYSVSPWEDGAVVLGAGGGKGHRLSVCCRADGSVFVLVIRPSGDADEKQCPPGESAPMGVYSRGPAAFVVAVRFRQRTTAGCWVRGEPKRSR